MVFILRVAFSEMKSYMYTAFLMTHTPF